MKKIIFCLAACAAIAFGLNACKNKCAKVPKDLKPIDCENYNDVKTVYWNFYRFCGKDEPWLYDNSCDTIRVEGWGYSDNRYIYLYQNADYQSLGGIYLTILNRDTTSHNSCFYQIFLYGNQFVTTPIGNGKENITFIPYK